jgi:hypothetical protein
VLAVGGCLLPHAIDPPLLHLALQTVGVADLQLFSPLQDGFEGDLHVHPPPLLAAPPLLAPGLHPHSLLPLLFLLAWLALLLALVARPIGFLPTLTLVRCLHQRLVHQSFSLEPLSMQDPLDHSCKVFLRN